MQLTKKALAAAMPNAKTANVDRWFEPLRDGAAASGINTPARLAGFLASVANETGELAANKELSYFNTPLARIQEVFGIRAPAKALLDSWKASGPEVFYSKFFNWVYDDRKFPFLGLGNLQEGDGARFVARGPGITGRANYRDLGKRLGIDLEGNPDLLLDPAVAAPAFAKYWQSVGNNERLDAGNFLGAMQVMNPGLSDFSHHSRYFEKAKAVLDTGEQDAPTEPKEQTPVLATSEVLREGSTGPAVEHLQSRLAHGGWYKGAINGRFDPLTKAAVEAVQRNLFPGQPHEWDGIVGPKTAGGLRL